MTFSTAGDPTPARPLLLDVVVPVFNEAHVLETTVRRLDDLLGTAFGPAARITIADNASTDGTGELAQSLAADFTRVTALSVEPKGRGGALRAAWLASPAQIVAYTDVDLSTDLRALLSMVSAVQNGVAEMAVGTRLHPRAEVSRGLRRELISRAYNRLLRLVLDARFSDAQCGCKAVRADVARDLLAAVRDDSWFFDTELLVLAQRRGLRILDVPVRWVDDPDSRVDVVATAWADLRGIARLRRGRRHHPAPAGAGAVGLS